MNMIYLFIKHDRVILRPFDLIQVYAKECVTNSMGTASNTKSVIWILISHLYRNYILFFMA